MASCTALTLTAADNNLNTLLNEAGARVVRAKLHEGVSRPYRGTVTLLLNRVLQEDKEGQLIDAQVRLALQQREDGGAGRSTRYFCAVIREVSFVRMLFSGDGGQSVCYELQLGSNLELLKEVSHRCSYQETPLVTLISSIFKSCGLDEPDASLLENKTTDTPFTLQQGGESDFVFLHRLLLLHGLNYNFVHPADKFVPQVYLSRGWSFDNGQLITAVSSGKEETQQDLSSLTGTLEPRKDGIFLRQFRLSRRHQQEVSGSSAAAMLPFALPQPWGEGRQALCRDYLKRSLKQRAQSSAYEAEAELADLKVQSGMELEVADFYGKDQSLTLKVRTVDTLCELPPAQDKFPGQPFADKLELKVSLAKLTPQNSDTDCGSWCDLEDCAGKSDLSLGAAAYGAPSETSVCQAVVSDGEGHTEETSDSTNLSIINTVQQAVSAADAPLGGEGFFYAVVSGESSPVRVQAVNPLRGSGSSLLACPRLGDQVMLLKNSAGFFLLGYLTSSTSKAGSSTSGSSASGSSASGSSTSDSSASGSSSSGSSVPSGISAYDCAAALSGGTHLIFDQQLNQTTGGRSSISAFTGGTAGSFIESCMWTGTLEEYIRQLKIRHNSSSYQSVYDAKKESLEKSFKAYRDALQTLHSSQLSYQQNLASKSSNNPDEALQMLQNIADSQLSKDQQDAESKKAEFEKQCADLAAALSLSSTDFPPRLEMLVRDGNARLAAPEGEVSVEGENGDVTFKDELVINAKEIVINADKELKLSVGGNVISLDRNDVRLQSHKWTSMYGMFDARLILDSVKGVSVAGNSIALDSVFNTTLRDSLGAELKLHYGALAAAFNELDFKSNGLLDRTWNVANLGAQLVQEIADMSMTLSGNENETSWRCLQGVMYGAASASEFGRTAYEANEKINELSEHHTSTKTQACELILCVLEVVEAFFDVIDEVLEGAFEETSLEAIKTTDKISTRDCIRLIIFAAKAGIAITTLVALPWKNLQKTEFAMENGNTTVKGREFEITARVTTEKQSAAAGIA